MRISVNRQLCEGNAVCEALAPTVFELDRAQQAQLVAGATGPGGEVTEEHRVLVERAVEGCPRLAIELSG
jgi:ferredoxin